MSESEDKIAELIAKGKALEEKRKEVVEQTLEERRREFTHPKTITHTSTGTGGLRGGCGCGGGLTKKAPPPIPPIVPGGFAEKPKDTV
jgi:hypothetical protein